MMRKTKAGRRRPVAIDHGADGHAQRQRVRTLQFVDTRSPAQVRAYLDEAPIGVVQGLTERQRAAALRLVDLTAAADLEGQITGKYQVRVDGGGAVADTTPEQDHARDALALLRRRLPVAWPLVAEACTPGGRPGLRELLDRLRHAAAAAERRADPSSRARRAWAAYCAGLREALDQLADAFDG